MKILHVLDHSLPEVDGYSIRSHNILLNQKKHGVDVIALTSPKHTKPSEPIEEIDGIRFYRTNYEEPKEGPRALPFFKESLLMFQLYRRILDVAKQEKVDLIHAHSPSINGIPGYRAGRSLRVPVLYEMRTLWEELPPDQKPTAFEAAKFFTSRWIETELLRRVDAVSVISQGLKQELINREIDAEKIGVFPNGVDIERFTPRNVNECLKRQLGLEGRFVVGFVGSFRYWEGLDLLVQAMATAVKRNSDMRLLLVGQDHGNELKKFAHSLNISEFVTFAGGIAPEKVLDYYSIIDLFVYPRKKMPLTELVTPLKPLEAMAMEKLVLASDVGGHKELIQNRLTGFLFKADDHIQLAKEIICIAADFERLGQVRQNARSDIVQTRDWDNIASRYRDFYRDVLGQVMQ